MAVLTIYSGLKCELILNLDDSLIIIFQWFLRFLIMNLQIHFINIILFMIMIIFKF